MAKTKESSSEGLEQYLKKLDELVEEKTIKSTCKRAVYAGTKIVANEIMSEIKSLPTVAGKTTSSHGITEAEKSDLIKGFGISTIDNDNNGYNAKIGFAGYGTKTKQGKYKDSGIPIPLTARSIISGTSWRPQKNDFIGRAWRRSKDRCVDEMGKEFDKAIKDIFKE